MPGNPYGGAPPMGQPVAAGNTNNSSNAQKHDIFVGNLAFNTTEEQLHQAFSEIGRVINVRLVTDLETGKPRGFAFVEFEDPQAALSAIRNMNDYELNGRRLRVNFSNSSHLEELAGKLGMDLSQQTQGRNQNNANKSNANQNNASGPSAGTSVVADALKGFTKGEAYDVIAKLKEVAERDPDEARRLISGHPQLPEALLFLMSNKLDMVKTPIATNEAAPVLPIPGATATTIAPTPTTTTATAPPAVRAADPRARMDPRMAAGGATQAPATAAPPARVDPRQRMQDPRARMQQMKQEPQAPPPPPVRVPPVSASFAPKLIIQTRSSSHSVFSIFCYFL